MFIATDRAMDVNVHSVVSTLLGLGVEHRGTRASTHIAHAALAPLFFLFGLGLFVGLFVLAGARVPWCLYGH